MLATDVNSTPLVVPPDMENARKPLEEEIKEHLKAIIMLKRRLNAITTISRLPGELLSEIFVCIPQDYFRSYTDRMRHDTSPYGSHRSNTDWIRVAHVCHVWREIALSTPRLWSFIPVARRSMAEQLLARSKKAPLSVAISYLEYNDDQKTFLETTLSGQTSRLTEVSINGSSSNIYELCDRLTEPASILHTLALSDNLHRPVGPDRIPHNLFAGQTPRLRSLEIRGLVIRWDNPLLCSTLTSLVITINCDLNTVGTFEQLLSTLEAMTGLHTLDLTNAIPEAQDVSVLSPPSRVLTFPHLCNIRLKGRALYSALFLHHISLDHISLAINVPPQLGSEPLVFDLIFAINTHLARSKPLRVLQLTREYSRLILHAWNTHSTFSNTFTMADPASFIFEIYVCETVRATVHRDLFQRSAMFTNIQTLVIETAVDWEWTAIFSGMPSLREIVIRHRGPKSMLVALSSESPSTPRGHTSPPLLPLLEALKFYDVRLASPVYGGQDEYFDQLIDCLIFRCNYNCPVQEVHITQCQNIVDEDMVPLREIVPEVVWDGVEDIEDVTEEEDEDEDEDEEDEEDEEDQEDEEDEEDQEDEDEYTDDEDDHPSDEDMDSDSDDDDV